MRKAWLATLTFLVAATLCCAGMNTALAAGSGHRVALATIQGSVLDNKGNPVAGAVISLLRDGAGAVVKQTRSAADGSFSARVSAGRYTVRAIAAGFSEVLFNSVQVRPSDEVVYRFNLQPLGQGRTLPERRHDGDDPKWRLRAAQGRRSIFQIQDGSDDAIRAVLGDTTATNVDAEADAAGALGDVASDRNPTGRVQGVVETFASASSDPRLPAFAGVNFAIAQPVNRRVDLVFAGQAALGNSRAPQRFETTARVRLNDRHRLDFQAGAMHLGEEMANGARLGQISLRAIDEWTVRDGVVVLLGLDYSRFTGASSARSISPRIGLQFDANSRTRLKASYAPGDDPESEAAPLAEGAPVLFKRAMPAIALVGGRATMERTRRFEFGVERALSSDSSIEASAFIDTSANRGVGLLTLPISAFNNDHGAALQSIASQDGSSRGIRVVYSRRISKLLSASAGYSIGRGQSLAGNLESPAEVFKGAFFQTAALQAETDLPSGTQVRAVLRFSPGATVFAIDPFAGRLAVYDPSLSILITQDLPTFGLPVRAQAVIDARNLMDAQAGVEDGDMSRLANLMRRSFRGGISVRF